MVLDGVVPRCRGLWVVVSLLLVLLLLEKDGVWGMTLEEINADKGKGQCGGGDDGSVPQTGDACQLVWGNDSLEAVTCFYKPIQCCEDDNPDIEIASYVCVCLEDSTWLCEDQDPCLYQNCGGNTAAAATTTTTSATCPMEQAKSGDGCNLPEGIHCVWGQE